MRPSVTSFNTLIAAASDGGSYGSLLEARSVAAFDAGLACLLAQPDCCRAALRALPTGPPPDSHAPCPQVGRALQAAEPDVRACCLNIYLAGLVKARRGSQTALFLLRGVCEGLPPTAPSAFGCLHLH